MTVVLMEFVVAGKSEGENPQHIELNLSRTTPSTIFSSPNHLNNQASGTSPEFVVASQRYIEMAVMLLRVLCLLVRGRPHPHNTYRDTRSRIQRDRESSA